MSELSPWKGKGLVLVLVSVALVVGVGLYLAGQNQKEADEVPAGFRDVASEAGITFRMAFLPTEQGESPKFKINLYDHGCGLAIGDFDGDGFDDVYFVNQLGPNALYHNNGDGTFEDVTAKAGVALGDRVCVGATFADTRNKGLQDLFVTSTRGGNVFFRNQGDGTFKDETKKAGLSHVGHSQTAVFFDYDNDGYLDLLVTNTAEWTEAFDQRKKYFPGKDLLAGTDFIRSKQEKNLLYHNNRDGTFTNVSAKASLKVPGWCGDVAVFDYDGDGYLDVLLTNMWGPSRLYRNNRGNGTFTDVTRAALGATSFGSIGAKVFDFNNDGKLDILLVDMHSDMWMGADKTHRSEAIATEGEKKKYQHAFGPIAESNPDMASFDKMAADHFGYRTDDVIYGNTFFKNLGGGKFEEISDKANLETFWPWGLAIGDFDNDGYEDVFIPSGMGYPWYYWPNYLMMNDGNSGKESFTNRAKELGIEPPRHGEYLEGEIDGMAMPRSSRCAAVADFRKNGRLDLVVNNFNDVPYYFQNNFPHKNYIAFRLTGDGTKSNRDAIGALVTIFLHNKTGKEEIMLRQVNPAGGYLSQSTKTVHFGLGDRPSVDRVEILWPSRARQVIKSPAINRYHLIVEGK